MNTQLLTDWTLIALVVLAVCCVAVLVLAVAGYDSGQFQIQFGSNQQRDLWPDGQPESPVHAMARAQEDLVARRRFDALVEGRWPAARKQRSS